MDLQLRARRIVAEYVLSMLDKSDNPIQLSDDDVYVVWFCKTLQHWRALISTTLPDGMYYKLTYDGNKGHTHVEAYKKFQNGAFRDFDGESGVNLGTNLPVIEVGKFHVMVHLKKHLSDLGTPLPKRFSDTDVHVIMLSETLQNWKIVADTWLIDDLLYEITYNGDRGETYVDVYKKWIQLSVADGFDSAVRADDVPVKRCEVGVSCTHCPHCQTCFSDHKEYVEHFRVNGRLVFNSCPKMGNEWRKSQGEKVDG